MDVYTERNEVPLRLKTLTELSRLKLKPPADVKPVALLKITFLNNVNCHELYDHADCLPIKGHKWSNETSNSNLGKALIVVNYHIATKKYSINRKKKEIKGEKVEILESVRDKVFDKILLENRCVILNKYKEKLNIKIGEFAFLVNKGDKDEQYNQHLDLIIETPIRDKRYYSEKKALELLNNFLNK